MSSLPPFTMHLTGNSPDGKTSNFIDTSAPLPEQSLGPFGSSKYLYSAPQSFNINEDTDLKHHQEAPTTGQLRNFPTAGGTVVITLEIAPNPTGAEGDMHKTNTIDFLFMMEGEVECLLNNGERRIFKRGECLFQRASWHSWRNTSKTEWARIAGVILGGEGAKEGEMIFPTVEGEKA